MADSREIPKYKCHKKVRALKIKEVRRIGPSPKSVPAGGEAIPDEDPAFELVFHEAGYAPLPMSYDYMRKHDPQAGGYYIVYEDGYKSFSPAGAFEAGYTRI